MDVVGRSDSIIRPNASFTTIHLFRYSRDMRYTNTPHGYRNLILTKGNFAGKMLPRCPLALQSYGVKFQSPTSLHTFRLGISFQLIIPLFIFLCSAKSPLKDVKITRAIRALVSIEEMLLRYKEIHEFLYGYSRTVGIVFAFPNSDFLFHLTW